MKLGVYIVLEDRRDEEPREVARDLRSILTAAAYAHFGERSRRFTIEEIEVERHTEPICPDSLAAHITGKARCMAPGLRFAAVQSRSTTRVDVMYGPRWIATASSKTMAKRIARALNNHKPNREGV